MLVAEGRTWREEGVENMNPRENDPGKKGRGFSLMLLLFLLIFLFEYSCYTALHRLQVYNILIQLLCMLCSPQVQPPSAPYNTGWSRSPPGGINCEQGQQQWLSGLQLLESAGSTEGRVCNISTWALCIYKMQTSAKHQVIRQPHEQRKRDKGQFTVQCH